MKLRLTLLAFAFVSLSFCTEGTNQEADDQKSNDLTTEAFKGEMEVNKAGVLIDVRTSDEFNEGHLAGAKNIDFYKEDFASQLDQLDKEETYFIYCRSGSRSAKTTKLMSEKGFSEVYNMLGGIQGWTDKGYPVE